MDLEVIDTAGEEEFMMFRDSSMSRADAFLALFALNSWTSFVELQNLIGKITREHDDDVSIPIIVIANKKVGLGFDVALLCTTVTYEYPSYTISPNNIFVKAKGT